MAAIYGHRWISAYGAEAATDKGKLTETATTWAQGLSGIDTNRIAAAIKHCMTAADAWPPGLPEFRALCQPRPEDYGMPSPEVALQEASRIACTPGAWNSNEWPHAAVYAAAKHVGAYRLQQGQKDARAAFLDAYRRACQDVIEGRDVAEIPLALPATVNQRSNKATAAAALQAIKQAIGTSDPACTGCANRKDQP